MNSKAQESRQAMLDGLFGELYHRRWRLEETFKRRKHRLHIECVRGQVSSP